MQPNQLSHSRVQELREEISRIANAPKANSETAAKCVIMLLACWPGQQNPDQRVAAAFVQQLINLCTGVDVDVLQALVDPRGNFVNKREFLPSIASVSDFIEGKMEPKASRIGWYLDEIALLERKVEPLISDEERTRRADMLRKTAVVIRETAKKLTVQPPNPIQQDCRDELMRTDLMSNKVA